MAGWTSNVFLIVLSIVKFITSKTLTIFISMSNMRVILPCILPSTGCHCSFYFLPT